MLFSILFTKICMSMFYDELANLMENSDIDDRFKNWVQDSFTTDFIDTYIVEHESCSQLESTFGNIQLIGIKPTMVLDINGSVNIYKYTCFNIIL